MGYIDSGKADGATVHLGGEREGTEGYFVKPTIFTNTKPDMKIVREEIFGPVGVVIKFEDVDGEDRFVAMRCSFLIRRMVSQMLSTKPTTRYTVLLRPCSRRTSTEPLRRHTSLTLALCG